MMHTKMAKGLIYKRPCFRIEIDRRRPGQPFEAHGFDRVSCNAIPPSKSVATLLTHRPVVLRKNLIARPPMAQTTHISLLSWHQRFVLGLGNAMQAIYRSQTIQCDSDWVRIRMESIHPFQSIQSIQSIHPFQSIHANPSDPWRCFYSSSLSLFDA